MGVTYAEAGVDRDVRAEAKKAWSLLKSTHSLSSHGDIIETPYSTLYPIGNSVFHTKCCDGVGTKVLLAQLAGKHDTIGIDAVASVVNDCIRCGAKPIALTNVIDAKKSTPELTRELQKGLNAGATIASCPIVAGETADVPELMSSEYHINCDCVGEVEGEKIIMGDRLKEGNIVIGLRSSGLHTNGLSLARKVLFKSWGGAFDAFDQPDNFDRELIYEALEPTKIYVREFLELQKKVEILGAVHITGDAYGKFGRLMQFSKGIGFELTNFKPHPIFSLIQAEGKVSNREMLSTFNMGWGFAIIVAEQDVDYTMEFLEKKMPGSEAIGKVTASGKITAEYNGEKTLLQ